MKIVADRNIPFAKEAFSTLGNVILLEGSQITRDDLVDVEALFIRSSVIVKPGLMKFSNMKYIASATAGTDHVNLSYLEDKGIGFDSAPGCNATSVAEYIISALLILQKQQNFDLEKKTLGIIGLGHVGSRVKKRAEILGIPTVVYDPFLPEKSKKSLGLLLKEADIITLHVPLTKFTSHPTFNMVDKHFLQSLKPGTIFINSSRGAVVKEQVLNNHRPKLSALVLDVWSGEPEISQVTYDQATLATPHIAGHSWDAKIRGTHMIYETACRFFEKKPTWSPQDIPEYNRVKKIRLRGKENPLHEAIRKAYNPQMDHSRFYVEKHRQDLKSAFRFMRKNYPIRREFSYVQIENSQDYNPETQELFQELGFLV